jgi:hypothetical protein
MEITYVTKSSFLPACESAINTHRVNLDSGNPVHVDLQEGGYNGRVIVTIRTNDRSAFNTDWESTDPTRFPARIKAAATALLHCGCEGRFEISHTDGLLTIRAV